MNSFKREELAAFARHYGFHYDAIDRAALVRAFRMDLERGLRGEDSSLAMIPSSLQPAREASACKTVVAIDAGGTALRAARIRFDRCGAPIVEAECKAAMPGTQGKVDAEAFYRAIAGAAAPLFDGASIAGVGFCFSYPIEIAEDGDAVLLSLSKELDAADAIGKPVGAGLRRALRQCGVVAPQRITLLNDAAAALLSGIAAAEGDKEERVVGFILGTGLNTASLESAIPKINFYSEERPQIVVHESGGFANPHRGILDIEVDAATKTPGAFTLEKACAGAYLGPLVHHILKQAVRDKVLCFKKSDVMLASGPIQTPELSEFLCNPFDRAHPISALFDDAEQDAVAAVLQLSAIVAERAAILCACALSGVVEHTGQGLNPLIPVRIVVEGTTYRRFYRLRPSLEAHLHTLLCACSPRYCAISPIPHASLFGAAFSVF